jgi:hypothetical protein
LLQSSLAQNWRRAKVRRRFFLPLVIYWEDSSLPKTFEELSSDDCRFVLDVPEIVAMMARHDNVPRPDRGPTLFCAAPVENPGKSYCATCAARVYYRHGKAGLGYELREEASSAQHVAEVEVAVQAEFVGRHPLSLIWESSVCPAWMFAAVLSFWAPI